MPMLTTHSNRGYTESTSDGHGPEAIKQPRATPARSRRPTTPGGRRRPLGAAARPPAPVRRTLPALSTKGTPAQRSLLIISLHAAKVGALLPRGTVASSR